LSTSTGLWKLWTCAGASCEAASLRAARASGVVKTSPTMASTGSAPAPGTREREPPSRDQAVEQAGPDIRSPTLRLHAGHAAIHMRPARGRAEKRTHPLFDVQVVDLVVYGAGGVPVGQGATPNATA
jgi:hypothetical protein